MYSSKPILLKYYNYVESIQARGRVPRFSPSLAGSLSDGSHSLSQDRLDSCYAFLAWRRQRIPGANALDFTMKGVDAVNGCMKGMR